MPQRAEKLIDARPIRPISDGTPWDAAVARREEFATAVRETLRRENVEAAVVVSGNGNYPPWVKMEAWLPESGKNAGDTDERERALLELVVEAKPYHEHEVVVAAKAVRGKNTISVQARPDFTAGNATEWTRFALGRGGKPQNYTPWLDAFRHFIHSMLPILPAPHTNRLQKPFRAKWTGLGFAGVVSVLVLLGGLQLAGQPPRMGVTGVGVVMLLLGLIGCVAVIAALRRRQHRIAVMPQPVEMPRNLGLVDSWHAVISDIGRDFPTVKARLVRAVANGGDAVGLTCRGEVYTHTLPNGYEQRERLVVSKDQGMVHVHIYPFGNDVFIGWQAYLNWSRWGETNAVSTRVREGNEVEFRDVAPAVYVPNQFDLIDLSSLSEFVHRRLEREIRALLKEKSIDQEIDFKIIRGDRDRALDENRHKASDKKPSGSWSYKTT